MDNVVTVGVTIRNCIGTFHAPHIPHLKDKHLLNFNVIHKVRFSSY